MTTVSTRLTDRMLVLATAGAARLGLTLDQALAMSDPFFGRDDRRKEASADGAGSAAEREKREQAKGEQAKGEKQG